MQESLKLLADLSRQYGGDHQNAFLGGGNTSYKDDTTLYIKPTGASLENISADDFIALDRKKLRHLFTATPEGGKGERERKVQQCLANAIISPRRQSFPSVEAPLHELLPKAYVFHLHPVIVNGMTCGQQGEEICKQLFPEALWINYADPGFAAAMTFKQKFLSEETAERQSVSMVFVQNHGIFINADSLSEIEKIFADVQTKLQKFYEQSGVKTKLPEEPPDRQRARQMAPRLRGICKALQNGTVILTGNQYAAAQGPLTPDHVAYAGSFPYQGEIDLEHMRNWLREHEKPPEIAVFPGIATFSMGRSLAEARNIQTAARNAALIEHLSQPFGGPRYLTEPEYEFLEGQHNGCSYDRRKNPNNQAAGRMDGQVCVVTGAAQGFGRGIARGLATQGAVVGLADLNLEGAQQAASEIAAECDAEDRVFSLKVNVADEESVAECFNQAVDLCGGMDLTVANAGVLRANSVKDFKLADWQFVTQVNYQGYFLTVKYASMIMAAQNQAGEGRFWSDIVQINSKSGLEGSSRNAAYAGSKFGAIGLTQSFAKELVEDYIKVNSVCPGNYFEGPLWSDPENGLFVQYLRAGKVPGAETIEDVKRFYESKVPMGRGCRPEDIVKAIIYLCEQDYETGQALPVSGGQVMLH